MNKSIADNSEKANSSSLEMELMKLISFNAEDAAIDMIEQGNIDPNFVDLFGSTLLINACYYDAGENVIEALLNSGADPNKANKTGGTPLSVALICKNDISVIKLLIKAGANVNAMTSCGSTPLIYAVRNKNPTKVIYTLLQSGADVHACIKDNTSPFNGFTALHFAVVGKQEENARLLVRYSAEITSSSKSAVKSPLELASSDMRAALLKERDIRDKKQQAVAAINKVKSSNVSIMEMIKQKASKSSMLLSKNSNPTMKSSNSLQTSSSNTLKSFHLSFRKSSKVLASPLVNPRRKEKLDDDDFSVYEAKLEIDESSSINDLTA